MSRQMSTSLTVTIDTDIRAWVQSTATLAERGGIPVLHIGGDASRRHTTGDADVSITFYGYGNEELMASLDRFAAGVELLRQAIVNRTDLDQQVVAAGQVAA